MNKYLSALEKKAKYLRGTGGGEALAEVIKVTKRLQAQSDRLDRQNRVMAALALCASLSEWHLDDTIRGLADLLNDETL